MNMKCEHPDHNENETCEDRAVACHKHCTCCLPPLAIDHVDKNSGQPCQHRHKDKVGGNTEWVAICTDCGAPLDKNDQPLPEHNGFDWDAWKDEMKEKDDGL
jgi:hypothetical protein